MTPDGRDKGNLTAQGTNRALTPVKFVQGTEFSHEIQCLQQDKPLYTRTKLLFLNPFLDEDGVIREGGRQKMQTLHQTKGMQCYCYGNRVAKLIISENVSRLHAASCTAAKLLDFVRQTYHQNMCNLSQPESLSCSANDGRPP